MKTHALLTSVSLLLAPQLMGQVSFGDAQDFNRDWKFLKGDPAGASEVGFDDDNWRKLNLPHDWSVEGPYSPDLASATGYLPGGVAWYRKQFEIPAEKSEKRFYIYFEGIYRDGEVFINGESLGMRPNGYISYMHDLTPHIRFGEANTLAVRVDHSDYADSRWYTGSGIYRNVFLVEANPVHIEQWGVYHTTPEITDQFARVEIETAVRNHLQAGQAVQIRQELIDADGKVVADTVETLDVDADSIAKLKQTLNVEQPKRWGLDNPYLYQLRTTVLDGERTIDQSALNTGFRTIEFDANRGFFLNGENMNLKGVCIHHDAGALGAAVPYEVWERRLKVLKSLGVNAIRTSHNPHAPDLYHLCDRLGMVVINEVFDEWEYPKKKWKDGWNVGTPGFQGHADFFEEWGEQDLRDTLLRDRNHPSVIMWSIGNEVDYPNDPYSHPILDKEGISQQHTWGFQRDQPHADRLGDIAHRLADIVREHDMSRPVTAGLAGPVMSNETSYPDALDVVGYNYTEGRYAKDHERYPKRILYGSENGHSFGAWKYVRDLDYIFAQFLWTGLDYLGESHRWPSRGFTSGLVDLAGFVKPRGEFRRALWSDEPMVYIGSYRKPENERGPSIDAPARWNYEADEMIRVVVYTNTENVELQLNGERFGEIQNFDEETGILVWDLPFQAGELKAIGRNNGEVVAEQVLRSSSRPHSIQASVYEGQTSISAERGVTQVEIQIVDDQGVPVYLADNEITCEVEGPIKLLALEASNPRDMGDYTNNRLRVHNGRLIAYIEATDKAGAATVRFSSPWLESAVVELDIR